MITNTAFTPIYDLFRHENLMIVPTFQRPYRWEDKQINTLIEDIEIGNKRGIEHYLSPVHLIEIVTTSAYDIQLLNKYTDSSLLPKVIAPGGLVDDSGFPVSVYLVIDGQQRLTTTLAILKAYGVPFVESLKFGGQTYPKLIAGSQAEDLAIRQGIGLTTAQQLPSSPAATRIKNAFLATANKAKDKKIPIQFFQRQLKTLAVCLDPDFALGAFLTLNDRGRPLTTLEKLKAHCMYVDAQTSAPNPSKVHATFGGLFRSIEAKDSLVNDDRAVQLATLIHIQGVFPNAQVAEWGAEQCFAEALSKSEVLNATKLSKLLDVIDGIAKANNDLIQGIQSTTMEFTYRLALTQRPLSAKALAIVMQFHARYKLDTETLAAPLANLKVDSNAAIADYLAQKLSAREPSPALQSFSAQIKTSILGLRSPSARMTSVLDLAVMVDSCGVKTASFMGAWRQAFSASPTPEASFAAWGGYLQSWNSRYNYISNLLSTGDVSSSSLRYKIALLEDAAQGKEWIRVADDVEHIFATKLSTSISGGYGFNHPTDYEEFCNRIGNIVPLDSRLNRSLNANNPAIKAPRYVNQTTVLGIACNPEGIAPIEYSPTAVQIGHDLSMLDLPADQREFIELRSIRMVCFAASVI